jgi:hypothetical protein
MIVRTEEDDCSLESTFDENAPAKKPVLSKLELE